MKVQKRKGVHGKQSPEEGGVRIGSRVWISERLLYMWSNHMKEYVVFHVLSRGGISEYIRIYQMVL